MNAQVFSGLARDFGLTLSRRIMKPTPAQDLGRGAAAIRAARLPATTNMPRDRNALASASGPLPAMPALAAPTGPCICGTLAREATARRGHCRQRQDLAAG